jgi:ABC-type phosphate transport system substrate-binding protein
MTYHSARRMLSACVAAVALVAAVAMATAGMASAATKAPTSDLTGQCSGADIKGQGSTFQAPAQEPVWNVDFNASTDTNVLGCAGNAGQGDGKKPTVTYESTGSHSGSGACLKGFGDGEAPKYEEYSYCGTDEAPSVSAEEAMEANKAASDKETKTIESIPVLQGSVAVLIHLPAHCVASDEAKVGGKVVKEGRLALDDATVAKIYEGAIRNWKEVEAAQTDDHDVITCTGGASEEETPINVVVRTDKSGTTHIFKSFIAQVAPSHTVEMEEFNEINEEGTLKKNPCGKVLPAEFKTWEAVQEGCENQRWPLAAKVVRPFTKGNPGVVGEVNAKASSIGYADLAVARKEGFFSDKCVAPAKAPECGGENKKGSSTKVGEQNHKFWAPIQNSSVAGEEYADPANNQDLEKIDASNCADTVYVGKIGEVIPPVNTREPWATVKAQLVQKKYAICGLTYDLALREYKPYILPKGGTPAEEEKGKEVAQTTRDYLLWQLSTKTQGGGYDIKAHDYEKVSGTVLKEAEAGVKEIGWIKP